MARKTTSVLPGFKLTLGYTVLYLSLIVLIPLACTFWKTSALTWDQFWHTVTAPRVLASYRLSFGASFLAALTNLFFGLLVAWVLVRYQFWGKRFVDALVDLPFALPTAVAGIALTAVYAPTAGSANGSSRWESRLPSPGSAYSLRSHSSGCRSLFAPCSRCWRISISKLKNPPPAWARTAGRRSGASRCRCCGRRC